LPISKVAATVVLADTDFFAPLFGADLRIPGFFAFGIFRFSFWHRRVTPNLRDYSPVNPCPNGVFTQSAESRSIHFQKYVQELNSFWCLCRRPVRCHGNPPMWRNGRRNGLKIAESSISRHRLPFQRKAILRGENGPPTQKL